MRLKKLSLLIGMHLLVQLAFSQDYWLQKDTVKGPPKSAACSFVLENKAFAVTGMDEFEYKRKMYSYRADQDDWDDELSLGGEGGAGLERVGAVSFALTHEGQQKGYVALGQTPTIAYMNDLWEYNPATQAWSQKANFTGAPRREAVSFVVGQLAYVGTGSALSGLQNDFFAYDPITNAWSQVADFAGTPRQAAVGFSMLDYGFVGTGDDGTMRQDFWMYNPITDQWIQKANFPGSPRSGACGWAAFPVCYLGTGEDAAHTFYKDLWEYNYYLNSWTQRADLPGVGRKNAIAFYLDGWGYIGTGYNNGVFLDDFWGYSGTASQKELEKVEVKVYPNPSAMYIQFAADSPVENLVCSDLSGKNYSLIAAQYNGHITLDIEYLPVGTYFLAWEQNSTAQIATFVKCD
jgi:N-acetylneuraminic acid mutarotase